MSMAGLQGAVSGAAGSIGRYFAAINTIPSLMLVLLVFFLISSGSWFGPPDVGQAWRALNDLGVGGSALLVLAALVLSLVLHPLQFSTVQLFEGYWGTSSLAQKLMEERVGYHKGRYWRLVDILGKAAKGDSGPSSWRQLQEAGRVIERYPKGDEYIMPTRLGNVLRRYEMLAGSNYGLDSFVAIPLIGSIAPPEQVEYLNDRRTQLDLAVRTSLAAFLACGISFVFLWRHGMWLLVVLFFYGMGYLAYRGAVVAAESYGLALVNIIDLNRFDLYRKMHLRLPKDSQIEGRRNKKLMKFLRYEPTSLTYEHPSGETDEGSPKA